MAYLKCPDCGFTVFDRNPLAPSRRCPRCAARGNSASQLERVLQLRGGAAGSVFGAQPKRPLDADADADAADEAAPAG
jgi:hypothetical protein